MPLPVPDHLLQRLLSDLTPATLSKVARVNKRLRSVCADLPLWHDLRTELKLPPPRPKARQLTSSHAIVMARACHQCRARKRLARLPLCAGCIKSHQVLGPAKHAITKTAILLSREVRKLAELHEQTHLYNGYNSIPVWRLRWWPDYVDSHRQRYRQLCERQAVQKATFESLVQGFQRK